MHHDGGGHWHLTMPLPSGTYTYAFIVNCGNLTECSIVTGNLVIDPDNLPFENVKGDAVASQFQVPYDRRFQYTSDIDLDFDFQLGVHPSRAGTTKFVNYSSPGSIHPAPDVHWCGVYLPHGYKEASRFGKKYPVLYLLHGGVGDATDWPVLANVSNIMDNLIDQGYIEPT